MKKKIKAVFLGFVLVFGIIFTLIPEPVEAKLVPSWGKSSIEGCWVSVMTQIGPGGIGWTMMAGNDYDCSMDTWSFCSASWSCELNDPPPNTVG